MNPGVFVMGGGGGGGGGSGKGSSSSGGQQGADGQTGGDGADTADGSAQTTAPCSPSTGCPNSHGGNGGGASRGDPVDVISGRVYTSTACDLALPAVLPFRFERIYSSGARHRDVGLGHGWSHSYAWALELTRRTATVWKGDATAVAFPLLDDGQQARARGGWQLARRSSQYRLLSPEGRTYLFRVDPRAPRRGHLEAILDRRGNRIELTYEGGVLRGIRDMVGRHVALQRDGNGRIGRLELVSRAQPGQRLVFARYEYDGEGDLVTVRDAEGASTSFRYDDHRLVYSQDAAGVAFHFVWDGGGRCIETWGENVVAGQPLDPYRDYLASSVPRELVDGGVARGFLHCRFDYSGDGYSEVVDSRKIQRFFANAHGKLEKAVDGPAVYTYTYDELGRPLSTTDALGSTRRYERDQDGRAVAYVDGAGGGRFVTRDDRGDVVERTDANGGVTRITRNEHGDWVTLTRPDGATWSHSYDDRGRVLERIAPNGTKTTLDRDDLGHIVAIHDPRGTTRRTVDELGRVTSETDPMGRTTRYHRNLRGDLLAVTLPDGGVRRYEYDASGRLITLIAEDGRTTRLERAGYHDVVAVRRPDGATHRLRYDREGGLVEIYGVQGRAHRYELDAGGHRVAEHTADGRSIHRTFDAMGRVIRMVDAAGVTRDITYDAAGQVAAIEYEDGSFERFEYDGSGMLVGASNEHAATRLDRDPMGRLVAEAQTLDHDTVSVALAYDGQGRRTELSSSRGHEERYERDATGQLIGINVQGERLTVRRDEAGRMVGLEASSGAALTMSYDARGRLAASRVGRARLAPGGGEPEWVGDATRRPGDRAYAYNECGWLVGRQTESESLRYEYDALHRLTRVTTRDGKVVMAGMYDASGNFEAQHPAPKRSYDAGGRLVSLGEKTFQYDVAGRLIEKSGPDGTWRFEWNARGLLDTVRHPDHRQTRYCYDALRRRIARYRYDATGKLAESVRFVWEGNRVLHAIHRRDPQASPNDDAVTTVTYLDETLRPIAQRRQSREGDDRRLIQTDHALAPALLVDMEGAITDELERTPWGEARDGSGTPLRLLGQWHDPETGLHYNRFRFYDPELGRYLSPDPLERQGSVHPYVYANNAPTDLADPFGLANSIITMDDGTQHEGSSGRSNQSTMAPEVAELIGESGQTIGDPVGNHQVGDCAEVDALSELARSRRSDPDTPLTSDEFGEVLADVESIETFDDDGNPLPCCPACRQMLDAGGALNAVTTGTGE